MPRQNARQLLLDLQLNLTPHMSPSFSLTLWVMILPIPLKLKMPLIVIRENLNIDSPKVYPSHSLLKTHKTLFLAKAKLKLPNKV